MGNGMTTTDSAPATAATQQTGGTGPALRPKIMRARCTKWDKSKDELTDEFIWDWIMTTVRNFKNNALPNIDELFQDQLVMSMTKSDIDARVMDYFHLCNTIAKTNELTALFSEEDGTKKKECLPDQPGRSRILRVSGVVDVEYCTDSGAETSCISSTSLKKICERGVSFEVMTLNTQIECKLPGGEKTWAREMTKLKLSLMTAGGPVNILQPVPCLILDNKDDEFLLGNDVLKALGINVERQLELLASQTCDDGDDDEAIPEVAAGDNDVEATRKAVEALIQRALDERFRAEKVERLRTIVYVYDIWRLVLGNDPPANVEPMRVRMKTGCSDHFGLFDFIKGYCQLPLAKECQELLAYMTHRKIYTPTRVPQGSADAALYFQSTIERCFAALLYKHLLVWIDDLLLYAADVDTYLDKLQEMLRLTAKFGFKLSVSKSCIYKREVKWCGKVINGEGVKHDSERIQALQSMPYPTNAGELQQFICSTNWIRDSIVDCARLARPLQDTLDKAMAQTSRRTKRAAAGIPIALTEKECAAYDSVKQALADAATLAFPKPDAEMVSLTDASDIGWSVIVTQVPSWKSDADIQDQQHELLICLGGTFTGAQKNWSVIEKEAYSIIMAYDKLSYLLLRPGGFRMPFSDGNFEWPTFEELQEAQQRHIVDSPQGLTRSRAGLLRSNERIWVPSAETSLVHRLLVIVHGGNRATEVAKR
ncbi:unnamed protein product [Phytophthora fragariaefolia]|uniref:Unnamed protein product n=1 Tax=Phytophthora fragariaefolia TaxID=1490495 RepID=A0A9W6Y5A0_9STRA|nr:unnamed protein product [Phytophthora fragariaefolia]